MRAGAERIFRRLDSPLVGRGPSATLLHAAYRTALEEQSCRLVTVLGAAGRRQDAARAGGRGALVRRDRRAGSLPARTARGSRSSRSTEIVRSLAGLAADDDEQVVHGAHRAAPAAGRRVRARHGAARRAAERRRGRARRGGVLGRAQAARGGRAHAAARARARGPALGRADAARPHRVPRRLEPRRADARARARAPRPARAAARLARRAPRSSSRSAATSRTRCSGICSARPSWTPRSRAASSTPPRATRSSSRSSCACSSTTARSCSTTDAGSPRDVGELPIPPSINALLAARLDRPRARGADGAAVRVGDRQAVLVERRRRARAAGAPRPRRLAPPRARPQAADLPRRVDELRERGLVPLRAHPRARRRLRDAAEGAARRAARALRRLARSQGRRTRSSAATISSGRTRARVELGPPNEETRALGERAGALLASAGRRAFARDDLPAARTLLDRAAALTSDPCARAETLLALGVALRETGDLTRVGDVLRRGARARALAGRRTARRAHPDRAVLAPRR